jgi:hypothetical protein
VIPVKIAREFLEVITRRYPQILITGRIIDHLQLSEQSRLEFCRNVSRSQIVHVKCGEPSITKRLDHSIKSNFWKVYHLTVQNSTVSKTSIEVRIRRREHGNLIPAAFAKKKFVH